MFLFVLVAIAFTSGAVSWALRRGRGGAAGLVMSWLGAGVAALVGHLAAQALVPDAGGAWLALGALVAALAYAGLDALAFGAAPMSGLERAPAAVRTPR